MRLRSLVTILAAILLMAGAAIPAAGSTGGPPHLERVDLSQFSGQTDFRPVGADLDQLVEVIVELSDEPVGVAYARAKAQGKGLTRAEQQALRSKLTRAQDQILRHVERAGGRLVFRYLNAYNGVAVKVPFRELPTLAGLPGVKAIHRVQPIKLENETSVPYIGAPEIWENLGATGESIRVAVIDTGIDYYHANFGGSGDPADYAADDPTVIEEGTFPTAKVIGGWDLVGDDYDASSDDPALNTPMPDPDPIDPHGHGTHVAGTIAGFGVDGEIGPGVAPDALLYAYKVFGREGSTAVVAEAIDMALDPNGDGDISDHVDVINMSLGSPFGSPYDPSAMAAQYAAEMGVIVVASAGNSGDVPYITGSPAVADGVISVAASADDGIYYDGVMINAPAGIAGIIQAREAAITPPLAEYGDVTGDVVYIGRGCTGDELLGDPGGAVALIDRGGCFFSEKILNAQAAGAIAVIVANNVAGDPIIMGGDSTGIMIPAVMISFDDGMMIKEAGATVNVTLSASYQVHRPDFADTMADFSSRGPGRHFGSFKPDLSAPGVDIHSSLVGTGTKGAKFSGTSMAAPHVAGVAALMRQLHPDWTVAEIKAALMNTTTPTSDGGEEYPISRQGTGRIQADEAAMATAVAMPAGLAFGHVPVTDMESRTQTVTVYNKSGTDQTYTLGLHFVGAHDGVSAELSAETLTVPAGGSAGFDLTLRFDGAALPMDAIVDVGGRVTLEEAGGQSLVVGFHAFPEKASAVEATTEKMKGNQTAVSFGNDGAADGWVSLFALAGTDGADQTVPPEVDITHVGARVVGDVLEFAVVTRQSWATLASNEFDIYLDVNRDQRWDYVLFSYDLGAVLAGEYWGEPVTFIYNLNTGTLDADYFVPDPYWYNARAAVLAVDKESLGIVGNANLYWAAMGWGRDGGAPDFLGTFTYSEEASGFAADTTELMAPATLTLKKRGRPVDLLALYPYNVPAMQAEVLEIK